MNREVLSKYDIMTVGEGSAVTYKEVEKFVGPERQELDMLYGFGPSEVRNYTTADCPDSGIGYSLIALKKMFCGREGMACHLSGKSRSAPDVESFWR